MRYSAVLFLAALLAVGVSTEKLKVDLYVEALCPYCQRMVVGMKPLFENGLADAMDLHMYYAGNAKMRGGRLACQHGRPECYLNKALNCAIAEKDSISEWFPFVLCVEEEATAAMEKTYETPKCRLVSAVSPHQGAVCARENTDFSAVLKSCAKQTGYDVEVLELCTNGEEGVKLQMAAYDAIEALKPPHRFVPWMVVNGMPIYDLAYSLDKLLCLQILPSDRPKVCYGGPPSPAANAVDTSLWRTFPGEDAVEEIIF